MDAAGNHKVGSSSCVYDSQAEDEADAIFEYIRDHLVPQPLWIQS